MNQNACLTLGNQLADAVLAEEQKRAAILAADFKSAWKEDQPVSRWQDEFWKRRGDL